MPNYLPTTHAHPNGLEASWWAPSRSSASSHDHSGVLLNISNRPRMRQQPLAPLGTREDVEREDFVSPVEAMFGRAIDRYRTAEETRRAASRAHNENMPNPVRSRATNATDNFANPRVPDRLEYAPNHRPVDIPWVQRAHAEFERNYPHLLRQNPVREDALIMSPTIIFDTQERPPPVPAERLTVSIACTICNEQSINVVLLPCMHACMCNWCADLCLPNRGDARCPKCRRAVKERRKLYLG